MTNYKVRYYRKPARPNASQHQTLTLDLLDLAHATVSETLQTRGPISAFSNQLAAFLTGKKDLTWKFNGPGVGRELRRAYSNIHGRVFARAYLEKYEGVHHLLPIKGNCFPFADRTAVRLRTGQKGDMPDWVGWDSTGIVVAEAKGTYAKGNWSNAFYGVNTLPQCLQNAQKQVSRVQIRYRDALDLEFKGWSVASRWSTEENRLEPWLAAIDPRLGIQPLTNDARRNINLALQRSTFSRIVQGLGYPDENTIGKIESSEAVHPTVFRRHRAARRKINIQEASPMHGLSAVFVNGAFLPVQSNDELDFFRERAIKDGQVWLVTVLAEALDATESGQILGEQETSRSPAHLSRNGLAITKVENATIANEE